MALTLKENVRKMSDTEPDNFTENLKVILKENLIIPNAPDWIRAQVTRDNTFKNPKYAEAEKYGRSCWNIAPYIQTFQEIGNELIAQRGYGRSFFKFLRENGVDYEIEDNRLCPLITFPSLKGITLRDYQKRVTEEASQVSQGVLCCPTGSGKSLMGLELIRIRNTSALIIVHKKELAEQWQKLIERVFEFSPGMIGDGEWAIDDRITIATVQTLARNEDRCRQIGCGLVLLDECHHAPAEQFAKVLNWFSAKYRYGLSATLTRRDGLDCLIYQSLGPVIASASKEEVESVKSIVPASVKVIRTGFNPGIVNGWHEYISGLNNAERNLTILSLIPKEESVLILTDRIIHAEDLSRMLALRKIDHTLAHGELPATERESLMQRIKDSRITIGTTSLLGEGLDFAKWSVLILASPISSEAKLLQAIGRVLRPAQGKKVGVVFDLHDDCGFSGHSMKSRMKIYEKHNIAVQFG